MSVKHISDGLLVDVYQYTSENQPVTIRKVKNHFSICRQHAHRALTMLRNDGFLTYTGRQGATPAKYFTTDKPFTLEKPKPKPLFKVRCTKPKVRPVETKTVEIEIKPDLAAMWLHKSPPRSEKRLIPIVRSTGLGARRNTF